MKKLPRVVIVGFPNVGKSTLFNRILGRRKSLVHSLPGMTRDSVSASAAVEGRRFTLVDTGGMFGVRDEPLSVKVREKAWQEAGSADLVLFVLDSKRDMAPAEEELYASLKKLDKPMLVVVNKVDSPFQEDLVKADFYRLGARDIFFVSAEHRLDLGPLEEALVSALPAAGPARDEDEPLKIAIVGRTNVGKSSLINRFSGEERLLVSEVPGTTRDSTDTLIVRDGKPFCLVDTAGIRKFSGADDSREKAGIIRSKANMGEADVICLVLDVREFPTRQDARIAQLAHDSGKPLVIALNKWDLVDAQAVDAEAVKDRVYRKLGFVSYAPLVYVSAVTGQRVVKILDMAEKVHQAASRKIETSKLNEFLGRIAEVHPPRLKSGAQVKLRYITQKGVLPPTFILFLGSRGPLAPAYERFFLETLREDFRLQGTPLRLLVRSS
ncbi:MAG: ribosome biogenesis GTPase Der [Candidatus Aminicenantes bacterium]